MCRIPRFPFTLLKKSDYARCQGKRLLRRFGAALQIATVMAGATAVNIVILHQLPLARLTAVLMMLALALAWLRRARTGQ